jgi:hypothetical protein
MKQHRNRGNKQQNSARHEQSPLLKNLPDGDSAQAGTP